MMENTISCDYCGKQFKRRQNVHFHLKVHGISETMHCKDSIIQLPGEVRFVKGEETTSPDPTFQDGATISLNTEEITKKVIN